MGLIAQVMKSDNDDEPFISIGLAALLILNKLTTSSQIKEIEKRKMSEDHQAHGHPGAQRADDHDRGKLANIK